ncbi:hypothetical protein NHP190002_09890 [Helicobacter ailurogastricus]|nr:hypothetical protein NHP190002_09890 [Helicobacter ailurogastricus]
MRAINLLLSLKTSILLVIEKNRTTISSVIKWLTNDGKKVKLTNMPCYSLTMSQIEDRSTQRPMKI